MNEDLEFLVKHRSRGALLDANLLLVYIVGKCARNQLPHFQHTKQYSDDFGLVERLVEFFPVHHTTPNVLTEVSNLGKKLGVPFFQTLSKVVHVLTEHYCCSEDAADNPGSQTFGLTDSILLSLGRQVLIVTADGRLHRFLRSQNVEAVNFHHIRPYSW